MDNPLPLFRIVMTRAVLIPIATTAALGLAACSSSSKTSTTKPAAPSSSSATSSTPSTSAESSSTAASSTASAGLTKADFVTKANAVCNSTLAKLQALPTPSSETDYPTLAAYAAGTLTLFPAYITQLQSLVGQSADKAELTTKWLAVEKADYASLRPLLEQLVAANQAKDTTKLHSLADQLNAAPDHSAALAAFLTSYGLTDCASLESS